MKSFFALFGKSWSVPVFLLATLLCVPLAAVGQTYQSIASALNDALPTNGSAGNLTITKPAGTVSGDVMLATISARPSQMTITAPAGWALYKRTEQLNGGVSTDPGGMTLLTYFKMAGGSEPANYTWTLANTIGAGANGGGGVVGTITRVSGVDTINPIDVYVDALSGNGLTHSAPSATTTVPNTLLVASITYLSSGNFGAPSGITGITERAEVSAPVANAAIGITLLVATVPKATAGATGSVSATADSSADYGMGHMFALAAPRPDLALAMTRTGNLDPGVTTSYYTLTVSNLGTATEGGTITVTNTLPANVSYTSNTGSTAGWSCSVVGQVVTCTTNTDLPGGATSTLQLNVDVGASASGTLTNTATVAGAPNNDGNTTNNTATNSYTIIPQGCVTSTVGADTVVTCASNGSITIPAGVTSVRYLVVAGGGGGGGIPANAADGAGGGGAGGFLQGNSFAVSAGTYTVTVGAGGAGGTGTTRGGNGSNSTFSTLTATGGGGGAFAGDNTGTSGNNGGSGGGGSDNNNGGTGTSGQGNNGGAGNNNDGGGGGGGANSAGANGTNTTGGNGGAGISNDINGTGTSYGGGGGGGADAGGAGGTGGVGGGATAPTGRNPGVAGTANTGGGGSGATGSSSGSAYSGGTGGSGIVIIRYPTASTVNHIRIEHDGEGLTCLAEQVTVRACADNLCSSEYTGSVTTTLSPAGWVGGDTKTFSGGHAIYSLSRTTAGSVTLGAASTTPTPVVATRCFNGASETCAMNFVDAGFIFSSTAGGAVATLPAQTAGTASGTYYLRAVKTSTTTQACEAALTGANTVNFAYECANPTTCYTSNLMNVNGGTNTTIARNDSGSVTSYTPVAMTFDANGNAPFTFNYSDAGQVKLHVSKAASGSLLTALSGASNAFVVAPANFLLSGIPVAPLTAGLPFNVTVTARTSTGATTFSFGRETPAASATLTSSNPVPGLGNATPINQTVSGFSGGEKSVDATWNEVGTIDLTAATSNYLGSGLSVTGSTAGVICSNLCFKPAYFDTIVTHGCSGAFTYAGLTGTPSLAGQPFTVEVKAKRSGGDLTDGTNTANYAGATWAKAVTLSDANSGTGTLANNTFIATDFVLGKASRLDVTYGITSKIPAVAPYTLAMRATDTDTVSSNGHAEGSTGMRSGRLRVSNAFGSEKSNLSLAVQAQYWSGQSWVINSADSCTSVPLGAIVLSGAPAGTIVSSPVTIASGNGTLTLSKPNPAVTANVDVAFNLGATGASLASCVIASGGTAANLPWLRSQNGSCAITYDRDPSARATFGIYSPETRKSIHIRELY
ncbi:MAG: hypothetical protein Q8O25_09825 [Sulfurisoma sp.]|nr:hypothetical protein [Sulfurisoma sp.]